MAADHHSRTTCRLCGGRNLTQVLALTPTPPANAFVAADRVDAPQSVFPLDVFLCETCAHVQLLDVVDPALLFENYVYVSGTSPVFVRHFQDYAASVIGRFAPPPGSLVIDIGSNDGTLLKAFREAGHAVLGIDPAKSIARAATAAGIETWDIFFSEEVARRIRAERGPAAVVTANNVFAHADELAGIVAGVRTLLAPGGVFVFEVSYLADVCEKTLFDTIYHEHLAYHTAKPLVRFFRANGMELIDAERVDSHGGSLRGTAQMAGGPRPIGRGVADLVAMEERLGLGRAETLRELGGRIDALRGELTALLKRFKADGKSIAGFGAPAKATTLMYHFGIGREVIDFIADDSPWKQGLFSPGLHVPVLPSAAIRERRPDILVILAWNFAGPIMEKHAAFREAGGRFVVPLPRVEIH